MGQGPDRGCSLISDGLNRVFGLEPGIMVLLETMAGKGTECGRNFEELATIIDGVDDKANVGVTVDTCHVLDAGYDLVNDFDGVMRQLDDVIGLERVKAVHVNDSQFGLSSHKDRHANIGDGLLASRSSPEWSTTRVCHAADDPRNQGTDRDHASRGDRPAARSRAVSVPVAAAAFSVTVTRRETPIAPSCASVVCPANVTRAEPGRVESEAFRG